MSKDMLGVPAEVYAGPIADLRKKLKSKDGEAWLRALKRFLRKEQPWVRRDFPFHSIGHIILAGMYQVRYPGFDATKAPEYKNEMGRKVHYLDLGAVGSSEAAFHRMTLKGYRPAEDHELLFHDMNYPEQLGYDYAVVVLGSVWPYGHEDKGVMMLRGYGVRDRSIFFEDWVTPWGADHRFAAVKLEEVDTTQAAESFESRVATNKSGLTRGPFAEWE